jgi:ribonuclease HII
MAPGLPCTTTCIIGGDNISLSIAAASIVAKVERDKIMRELAEAHPLYGWHTNVGYSTQAHLTALKQHGPSPHHRRSFRPVYELLLPID